MSERHALPGEVQSLGASVDGARGPWAETEARAAGHGGITGVARATGIAYSTIRRGLQELVSPPQLDPQRIRHPGGSRKNTLEKDPTLLTDLEGLVEPTASGDPQSPLRWTSKSVRHLATALPGARHQPAVGGRTPRSGGLQFAGPPQGSRRPEPSGPRRATQPVISVDTKKKELVGDFKNAGRQWRPKGQRAPGRVHDVPFRSAARPFPTGSTTSPATPAG